MKDDERIARWLHELDASLEQASVLAARGRHAYDTDPALPLAFEALINRIGDLAKRLTTADTQRFGHPAWRAAARTRDFVVHHYDRIDSDLLWQTVTVSLPELHALLAEARRPSL